MSRRPRPDFLVIGAPKAGTSALHAALRQHPQVHVPPGNAPAQKEPKFYLCDDAPPPSYRGPGDRHSAQEWSGAVRTTRRCSPALPRMRSAARARRSICGAVAPTDASPRTSPTCD